MRSKRWVWAVGSVVYVGLLLAGAGYWWFTWGPGAAPASGILEGSMPPRDPQEVALGQQVYQANCAMCHGVAGEGHPN